uniref:Uncharacterized protein n=1 Tax=Magnetococcus massalia (strain MO-1) TaxID=451514 RepID=A0A1S7LEE6_MAGMO|nr:Conserved protein of unknown function [Candidatus Magnetococcus massalia]
MDCNEFGPCAAGDAAEGFRTRIVQVLEDTLHELDEHYQRLKDLPEERRDEDERLFLTLHAGVVADLVVLNSGKLRYHQQYELSRSVQERLLEMGLLY